MEHYYNNHNVHIIYIYFMLYILLGKINYSPCKEYMREYQRNADKKRVSTEIAFGGQEELSEICGFR